MPQRIKYRTDYTSLQQAFDSLLPQDTLFLNLNETLTSTVYLRQRQVTIFGRGAVIQKGSGLAWDAPLIEINNDPIPPGTQKQIVNDVVIDGIRFENSVESLGTGSSRAIRLKETLASGLYHIKLQNVTIDNFQIGVLMEDAFDVVVDNCQILNCGIAMRPELVQNGVGGIKVTGGFFIKNSYGISVDDAGPSNVYRGQIALFGVTFGHDRTGTTSGNISVYVAKPIGGIFVFGCHFEDVTNVIYFAEQFPDNTSAEPMVVSVVGSDFFGVKGDYAIDTRNAKPHVDASCIIGNYNWRSGSPTKNLTAIPQIDTDGRGGLLIAANSLTAYPSAESTAVQQNSNQIYPLPIFSNMNRPAASAVPKGTAIFNITTNRLNISDGSNWRDANGNIVWASKEVMPKRETALITMPVLSSQTDEFMSPAQIGSPLVK